MSADSRWRRAGALLCIAGVLISAASCQALRRDGAGSSDQTSSARETERRRRARANEPPIRQLVCLFDQKPWISVDAAGDRDPEGLRFRVFLDGGAGKGVLREGTFHIELYQMARTPAGNIERTLASDWHYPTRDVTTVEARMLGKGYLLQLRWASKELAGSEIEIITRFEDEAGRETRGGNKRLRVPKYTF